MAHYLVRGAIKSGHRNALRERLNTGEVAEHEPFGEELASSLEDARWDPGRGEVVWEEEDYCTPPLRQEREAVLDTHFTDLEVEELEEPGRGWARIQELPSFWEVPMEQIQEGMGESTVGAPAYPEQP